jgi:rhamnose transport system substrate-binding protein
MSLFRRSRALLAASLAIALAIFVAACGDTKSSSSSSASGGSSASSSSGSDSAKANPNAPYKKGMKVVVMPKQLGNPYEETEDRGTVRAIQEIGGSASIKGPTDAGASSQVPLLQSIIQTKPDAIVLAGNDPNAVAPVLRQAIARDIGVVAQDSDVAPDARKVFINQASTEQIGRSEVQILGRELDYRGDVAILSATANATNQNAWIRFMRDELSKPRYRDMRLVKVAYGDDDDQKSFQETQGLLSAYPSLRGIISPTTVGISAAARYLSSSPKKGQVKLTGLGTPNQMRKFVRDGTVTEFALWNPEDVGYLGGYAAAALVSGQITGAEGETFRAGKLGERRIGADGEVILGPPTVFDKANIDRFDF